MKPHIPHIHFIGLLLTVTLSTASATEMLANPGFEGTYSGGVAPNWSSQWPFGGAVVSAQSKDAAGHTGSCQFLSVSAFPAGAGYWLYQTFTATRGHLYQASVWLRSDGTAPATVQVMLRQPNLPYTSTASKMIAVGTTWTQVTIQGGLPVEADSACYFGIVFASTGDLWVDDASLTDVTATSLFTGPTPTATVPASFIGMHINKLGSHFNWPALGQATLRLWDTGTQWADMQTSSGGAWNTSRLDLYLNYVAANAPGAAVNYTLGLTPLWAASNPGQVSGYPNASPSPPANMADWDAYVKFMGNHCLGKVKYWEIWNEADNIDYSGSVQTMVQMTQIAHDDLKAIDPSNIILSPSCTISNFEWLDRYLFYGGAALVDGIAFHVYQGARPEDYAAYYTAVRSLANSYGLAAKPIMNTEGGLRPSAAPDTATGMAIASRSLLVQWSMGVANFNFYDWDIIDPAFVNLAVTETGATLTEAGIAYQTTGKWLVGGTVTSRTVDANDTWTLTLTRSGGYSAVIAWNAGGNTPTLTVPNGMTVMRDLDDLPTSLAGVTTVVLSAKPILLENQASSQPPTVTCAATVALASKARSINGQVTIRRTGSTTTALPITYAVGGTAAAGADYTALPGSVTIPAGAVSVAIPIIPQSNTIAPKTVAVTLRSGLAFTRGLPMSATVTISDSLTAPVITQQPTDQSVSAGTSASFTVVATGTPSPTYQWLKNGANIAGATATSYTTPATALADDGEVFSVVVSNSGGDTPSNGATLTVTAANPPPTATSSDKKKCGLGSVFAVLSAFVLLALGGRLVRRWPTL